MNKRGFTLIEIVLAIAIAGILFVAIGGLLLPVKQSIQIWKKKTEEHDRLQSFLGQVESDLRFAFNPAVSEQPSFVGTRDRIEFFGLEPLHFVNQVSEPGVQRRVYRYLPSQAKLERSEKMILSEGEEFLTLAESLQDFRFQFYGEQGWQSDWNEKGWPRGIQVQGVWVSPENEKIVFHKQFFPVTQ